ncbi:MAG: DPP IV N-terminal domain-containing protein, partial [Gemmatimonadota bacterium]
VVLAGLLLAAWIAGSSVASAPLRAQEASARAQAAPALASEASLRAQEAGDGLTVERIYGTSDFSARSFTGTWRSDGAWIEIEPDDEDRLEIWRVDAVTGDRERLVTHRGLTPEGADEPVDLFDVDFSPDGDRLLLFTDAQQVWRARTKGVYWIFDLEERTLRPLSDEEGWQMFAKFSPGGDRVAFVREGDLFTVELSTGEERRLTDDGGEDIINGTTDWVYEEELGLRDAFRWSPDGQRIAYWKFDQSPIPPFHLLDETSLYPELNSVRYPKAGTDNSVVRVGSMELESGETTWFEVGPLEDHYLPRMEWISEAEVAIQRLNRHQNRLQVLLGDATTGATRELFAETDSAWVDVSDDYAWIGGGDRLVWPSERDGWRHLYLYDHEAGLVRQLTSGAWEVTGLEGVDEEEDRVYFTAARQHPYTRSVGWVSLDGGEPRWLVGPAAGPEGATGTTAIDDGPGGVHGADFSPDFDRFVHTASAADAPPLVTLRDADGEVVRTLEDNAELRARLDSLELAGTEFTTVPGAEGDTLNAWLVRPAEFDTSRPHPLLMYVYGGPGAQTVMDAWGDSRHLWHQMLARRGILVASVDNRGTGGRGRDFEKATYLDLGALETADQLAAARHFADRPWVDEGRIGIWGWSYGGYMTLLALLESEGALAAGVSVAPVTHWKFYDTIYTERFMRTPAENPEGYERSAPLNRASRLDSDLLIVHGTGDDNVHPQHTTHMVQALEEAGKQFRMRIYPNKRHGIAGTASQVNLFEMITGFLTESLGAGD